MITTTKANTLGNPLQAMVCNKDIKSLAIGADHCAL
jgi:hypothetical protein